MENKYKFGNLSLGFLTQVHDATKIFKAKF